MESIHFIVHYCPLWATQSPQSQSENQLFDPSTRTKTMAIIHINNQHILKMDQMDQAQI